MVSYLKILQCIPKLWTGQENLDGRPNALTHSHWGAYVELTASELNKNHLTKKGQVIGYFKSCHLCQLCNEFRTCY